jgi:hypothetical protein
LIFTYFRPLFEESLLEDALFEWLLPLWVLSDEPDLEPLRLDALRDEPE